MSFFISRYISFVIHSSTSHRRAFRRRVRQGARESLRLAVLLVVLLSHLSTITLAQQIVVDGRTATTLATTGNVTDVTTSTIRGNNGINSFTKLDVDRGNVVNLHVPDVADNLINLVTGDRTDIHGTLNSIHRGAIGGNIYVANPHGVVVGEGGVVNVGSLMATTPSQAFVDDFFDGSGQPSTASTRTLLAGSVPLSEDGAVVVEGTVNARRHIHFRAGDVTNTGTIQSGAYFANDGPSAADVVNLNGYGSANAIAVENGDIVIFARNDVRNSGTVASDGAINLDAGSITIRAGNDLVLSGESVLSARGRGSESDGGIVDVFADDAAVRKNDAWIDVRGGDVSGDGGFAELSAGQTVSIEGGGFRAGATNGKAGEALVDPEDLVIAADDFSDGGDLTYQASKSITVSDDVVVSSRDLADVDSEDHRTASSTGDSGAITFEAPDIDVNDGAAILAHADNAYASGDVTFQATDSYDGEWGQAFLQNAHANASITIGDAKIRGDDVEFNATASTSKLANLTEDIDSDEENELTYDLNEDAVLNLSVLAAAVIAHSTAEITIAGGAEIIADDTLDVDAAAAATANAYTASRYLGVTYGFAKPTTEVTIEGGAHLEAGGDVNVSGISNATLNTLLLVPGSGDVANISFAYGKTRATSDVRVEDGASITGANINIEATNSNYQSVSAIGLSLQQAAAGAGVSVSIGDYDSIATATVAGDVYATGDLDIAATSTNLNKDTRASATVLSPLGELDAVRSIQSKVSSQPLDPKSDASSFQMGAAVVVVNSNNTADASIAAGADVIAEGDLSLAARSEDNFQASASGTAGDASTAVGGAVLIGTYSNTAKTHIATGSVVDAGGTLGVHAIANVPNQVTYLDFGKEYPDDEEGVEDFLTFIEALTPYLNLTLGLESQVATHYVHSEASASPEQGGDLTVSGMANVLTVDNTARAWIGEDAEVNQRPAYATDSQNVDVHATGSLSTVEIAGMASILNPLGTGTAGADSGVGGAYNGVNYANSIRAWIDDGAVVDATTDVRVKAESDTYLVVVAQAGDKSAENGLSGAFSVFTIENDTLAWIDDEAEIAAGGDVDVSADSRIRSYNVNGGFSLAKNVGVGLSVSYIGIDNTTKAFIGNADDVLGNGGGYVNAGGDVTVTGESTYELYSLAVSGAAPVGTDTSDEQSEYGVGVSGDASVNDVKDVLRVFIGDTTIDAAGDVGIDANSDTYMVAGGGSIAFNENVGIGGSYSHNILDRDTLAYTERATIEGANVKLESTAHDRVITVAAGGGGAKEGTAVAGSVVINELGSSGDRNRTEAGLGDDTDVDAQGDVTVTADDELDLISIAGTVGATAGAGVGVGVALGIDLIYQDVRAYIGNSASLIGTGNLVLNAFAEQDTIAVIAAGAGSTDGFAGVGSAAAQQTVLGVEAVIEDGSSDDATEVSVDVDGSVALNADSDATVTSIAGSAAFSGNGAIGAATSDIVRSEDVIARIGTDAAVTARGETGTVRVKSAPGSQEDITGVSVVATSDEEITNIAAGGTASGSTVSALGSATVTSLDETTRAIIADGASIDDTGADDDQGVNLVAADDTTVVDVAGAAAFGGNAGIGIGVDVISIDKETQAAIGAATDVAARNNVRIRALVEEDLTSVSGALAAASDAGVASSVSTVDLWTDTRAEIGDDAVVTAAGSVIVTADDENEIDVGAGNAAFGGTAGVGAAVAVVSTDKTTHASIGANAAVTALGTRDAIAAPTGKFVIDYVAEADDDVQAPESEDEVDSESIGAQRTAALEEGLVKGLAVTATNRDDVESIAVSGSAAGNAAVNIAANVGSITNDTVASVGVGASINADNSGAGGEQSILVAAANDVYRLGVSGLLASGGTAGVAPGADVAVINNTTKAFLDSGVVANATEDVAVVADGEEDLLSVVAGLGVAGNASIAGAVTVAVIDNDTFAFIGEDSAVDADGNVLVAADDRTTATVASGAGAFGGVGVGGSIGVNDITKATRAYVGTDADVTARGNSASTVAVTSGAARSGGAFPAEDVQGLVVSADSSEDILAVAVAGAGGFYAGVAGAVTVSTVDSDTAAFVSDGATINDDNSGAAASQDVHVAATNTVGIRGIDGSIAGSVAGSIAGSVDVADLDNSTSAFIASGAAVQAEQDIGVAALSDSEIDSVVVSASGGVVGIAGAVGVYSMVADLSANSTSELTTDSGDHDSVQGYVDAQLRDDSVEDVLDETGSDDLDNSTQTVSNTRSGLGITDSIEGTSVGSGTSAFVGDAATLTAGGDIELRARSYADIDALDGAATIGVLGVGAGVGVAEIEHDTAAKLGADTVLTAGGHVEVTGAQNHTVDVTAFAGSLSLGAAEAAVATVDEKSDAEASIGDGSEIRSATDVTVEATAKRTAKSTADGAAVGALAAGASFTEASIRGSTLAAIGSDVSIGNANGLSVSSLTVHAKSDLKIDADSWAAAGGIGAGSGNDGDATINEDTTASIGDNADITTLAGIELDAESISDATVEVWGLSVGGVSVDVSDANSKVTNDVTASVGENGSLAAGTGDLLVRARRNVNDDGSANTGRKSKAKATSSVGTLVGGNGAEATARLTATVAAKVGDGTDLSGDDVTVESLSSAVADADANGNAYGVAAGGATNADVHIDHSNVASVGSNSELTAANDLTVTAITALDGNADAKGGSGGIVAGASTDGTTEIDDSTSVAVGMQALLTAAADIAIEALASYVGYSRGDIDTGGAVTTNLTTSKTELDSRVSVDVDDSAELDAETIQLRAEITGMDVDSKARSKTYAADSTTKADSTTDVVAATNVTVGDNVVLAGERSVDIIATFDESEMDTYSDAVAAIGAGVTGTVIADARNDLGTDADVAVGTGSVITTAALYVEATGPQGNDVWRRNADAQAQTVIQYIVEYVEVVEKKTKKIPVIGWIVKWVTKTVKVVTEKVLNSNESAKLHGTYASDSTIDFNADVYESDYYSPRLVIGPDGSIIEQVNVDATIENGVVTVDDITNEFGLTVELYAPGGTVSGTSNVYLDNTFGAVQLINESANDFALGAIRMFADNGLDPDISITADEDTSTIEAIVTDTSASIDIENRTASDIRLLGTIDNATGSVTIENLGGSILAESGGSIVAHDVSLSAQAGGIGSATNAIAIDIAETDETAQLEAIAGTDIFLDLRAVAERAEDDAGALDPMLGVEITDVIAGNDVSIDLRDGHRTLLSADDDPDAESDESVTYELSGLLQAGGDILARLASAATLELTGLIERGLADISYSIAADGSVAANQIDFGSAAASDTISVRPLAGKDGTVTIDGTLTGDGTIRVLDGYTHVSLRNESDKDLVVGDIDLSMPASTTVIIDGVVKAVPGTYGAITLETTGYNSGKVTIENTGNSDVVLAGNIDNPSGLVDIGNSIGDIRRDGDSQKIVAALLNLASAQGAIGAADALWIHVGGAIAATADGDVRLVQIAGDASVDRIVSATGTAALTSFGAIVEANSDNDADISGNRIELVAFDGGIGSATTPFEIDSGSGGLLAVASSEIGLTEVTDDLVVDQVNALGGDATVRAPDGSIRFGFVGSTGTTTIDVLGDMRDVGSSLDVRGVDIALKAGGAIGLLQDSLEIDGSFDGSIGTVDIEAGAGIFVSESNGDLRLGDVASGAGLVRLFSADADVVLGKVEGSDKVLLWARGSILDGTPKDGTDVTGSWVDLFAGSGRIGSEDAEVFVDSERLTATGTSDIFLASLDDLNIDQVTTTSGRIRLAADGSLRDARVASGANVVGGDEVELISRRGWIGGSRGQWFRVASDGPLSVQHFRDAYVHLGGTTNRIADTYSEDGGLHLLVGTGNLDAESIRAADVDLQVAAGDAHIGNLEVDRFAARIAGEGRRLDVDRLVAHFRMRSIEVDGDNVSLNGVESVRPVTFTLHGNDGGLADYVEVTGASRQTVRFDELFADRALIDFASLIGRRNRISIRDLLVASGATIRNSAIDATVSGDASETIRRLSVSRRATTIPRKMMDRILNQAPRVLAPLQQDARVTDSDTNG